MVDSWVTLLIFLTTSCFAFSIAMLIFDRFLSYRLAVRGRLSVLDKGMQSVGATALLDDVRLWHSQDSIDGQAWLKGLQQLLDQSGTQCRVSTLLSCCGAFGLIAAAAGAFQVGWLGGLLMPIGAAIPLLVLIYRKRLRQLKLSRQLPEAFSMISRAVRAGQTVPSALQVIAEDFDAPIATEFARCYEQQNLGMNRETALRMLATRSGIMELQIFVVALLVQARSGGDLVELLDNLALVIRKRMKLRDRVRALTGEGRMQALVLIVLPFAALIGITFFSPAYAQTLFDRPWLLGATAAAQALGALWIRRIVNFEY